MAEIFSLILAYWGSLLQVQWRQMSTNAVGFRSHSVPFLKWSDAGGPSGWTDWGDLSFYAFGYRPTDWLVGWRMRWDAGVFHQLVWDKVLMYDRSSSNTWPGWSIELWTTSCFRQNMTVGLPPRLSDCSCDYMWTLHSSHWSTSLRSGLN